MICIIVVLTGSNVCLCLALVIGVFVFKQKTAYEMRIGDLSSDVCSSDLEVLERLRADAIARQRGFSLDAKIFRADGEPRWMRLSAGIIVPHRGPARLYGTKQDITEEIGRAHV